MKKISIFNDDEFQALDADHKREITDNYFDKVMADDAFRALSPDHQAEIRQNFADAQIDFSVKDTAQSALDYLTGDTPNKVAEESGTPPDMSWDVPAPLPEGGNAPRKNPAQVNNASDPYMVQGIDDGVQPEDGTATRPYGFDAKGMPGSLDPIGGTMISPADQDVLTGRENAALLFGDEDYENPDAADWELGKRLVNRTNELTANAVQATYNFLGNLKTPMEYLGISTEAQDALNAKRADWFDKAATDLNNFVYEQNKLDVKPTHTWAETKKAFKTGGVFDIDAWQELLNYGGSEAFVSAFDMAEMVAALPLYFASRLQESAEKRAENDGRKEVRAKDYFVVAPTTLGSIILDRMGLMATTRDVVQNVGKEALDGTLMDAVKVIGTAAKRGAIVEGGTEGVQNPLEKFGEEVGTAQGLDTLSNYADEALAGAVAGAVMGTGMSGTTSTGAEVFKAYSIEKQAAQREAFIVDAYKRDVLGNGLVMATDDGAFRAFSQNLGAKIHAIQSGFENLTINHPERDIPVEAVDDIAVQAAVVEAAKAEGLDVGDADGMNEIDKGYKALAEEMGYPLPDATIIPNPANGPIETLEAFPDDKSGAMETPTEEPAPAPIIEKPVIGQPEPEAKRSAQAGGGTDTAVGGTNTAADGTASPAQQPTTAMEDAAEPFSEADAARLDELEAMPDDETTIDEKWELEDLREKRDAVKPDIAQTDAAVVDRPAQEEPAQPQAAVGDGAPQSAEDYWLNATETDRAALAAASGYKGKYASAAAKLSWEILDDVVKGALKRAYKKAQPDTKTEPLPEGQTPPQDPAQPDTAIGGGAAKTGEALQPAAFTAEDEGRLTALEAIPAEERSADEASELDALRQKDNAALESVLAKMLEMTREKMDAGEIESPLPVKKGFEAMAAKTPSEDKLFIETFANTYGGTEMMYQPSENADPIKVTVLPISEQDMPGRVSVRENARSVITIPVKAAASGLKPIEADAPAGETETAMVAADTNRDYVVKNYSSLTPEQKTQYQDTLDALYQERLVEVANALGVKVAEMERTFEHTGAGANVTGATYYGVKDELQDMGVLVGAVQAARQNTSRFDELSTKWEPTPEEETEIAVLADGMTEQLKGEDNANTDTERAGTAAPAATGDTETVPAAEAAGTQRSGGESAGDQRVPGGRTDAKLTFDTEKVYSTKGIVADYPNKKVGKQIQRDVAKYVGQLAKALGYEFAVDKKGKKLPWNGVSANLAPAGGDISFRLYKPGSDVGVYMTLSYQPDITPGGSYENYRLRGVVYDRHMWRTTTRGKGSRSDGGNNWAKKEDLTDPAFIDAIIEAVDAADARAAQAGTKNDAAAKQEQGADNGTDKSGSEDTARPVPANGGRGAGQGGDGGIGGSKSNDDDGRPGLNDTSAGAARPAGEIADERGGDTRPSRSGNGAVRNQFVLSQNDAVAQGEVARFNANFSALKILKSDKAFYTKEELEALSRYTGWGGVQSLFPRPDGSFDSPAWRERHNAFKSLITEEEYQAAFKSILDAFYTPPAIIGSMWDISRRLGFDGGHVLEPSAGVGRFIGMTPTDLKSVSFTGVELDPVTAKIATILYPKSSIRNIGFEKTNYPGTFEMVIGNPPYGDYKVRDPQEKELSRLNIHNYFVAKALKALKPGGVLNFIITASFMENLNATTAKAIDAQAKLVGAIRLPSSAFSVTGTEVTTDIVIFQKLAPGEKGNADEWFGSVKQASGINLNKYFDAHPEMLIGKWEKGYRGNKATADAGEIMPQLERAVGMLPMDIMPSFQGAVRQQLISSADTSVPPSVIYEKDGRYFVNVQSASADTAYQVVELKADLAKSYMAVRDALRTVVDLQNSESATDAELKTARQALNSAYNAFKKQHGLLNKAQNRNLIVNDNYGYTVLALEIEGKKAPIFTTRTTNPVRRIKTDNAKEALTITVNTKGNVDLGEISEITWKDEDAIIDELRGEIFFDVAENKYVTKEVYLSGDVKTKLANTTDDLAISELQKVIPEDKKPQDIPVQTGVSWIGPEYIVQFAKEVMGFRYSPDVRYSSEMARWDVKGDSNSNPYDIPGYRAGEVLESALNQKRITVRYTENGKTYVDEERTAYANQKLEELKDRFSGWVWEDAKRSDALAARYNELFNRHVVVDIESAMESYDIPNTSASFKARRHQKRAVYRAVYGNSPLLFDHPVGSGKTFTSQMVAMEWKRLGIANKPVIATLKSVVPQYAREFKIAYPNANILVPTESDFSAKNRKRLLSTIATGNYDAIIITHDNLKALENPTETVREVYEEQLAELKNTLADVDGMTRSRMRKRIEKLKDRYDDLTNIKKDTDVLSFDQLGIDGLIIDESHIFKKIGFATAMDVKGVDSDESQIAVDLLIKTRHILKSSNNVVLMTGTPITNTLPELFAIQRLLQPKLLKQQRIYEFDAWAKQYTVTDTDIETTGVGKLKEVTRIKNYTNLDVLYASVGQIMDTVTNEEIKAGDSTFILPPLKNGKPTQVILEPSAAQLEYAQKLDERLNTTVRDKEDPDNYLSVFGDAERMSLDIRFVVPDAADNPNSKANQSVARAVGLYRKFDDVKGVQMFFSDIGVPNRDGRFDLYNDIKKKLIAKGVPAKEIALISDYNSAVKKSALSKKARAGEVRFIIGGTKKLGTGINMQDLLVAEHHLDIPYTPAELEQRYGRILRQGNKLIDKIDGFEVEIFLYATAKTLDGSKWQILKNKMEFIHAFQRGDISETSEIDIDEGSQKEQAERMIALASGNPLLIERVRAEKTLKKLRALKRGYDNARMVNLRELEYEKGVLSGADTIVANLESDRQQVLDNPIMIGSETTFETPTDLGQAVLDELMKYKEMRGMNAKVIGGIGEIEIKIEYSRKSGDAVVSLVGKTKDKRKFELLTQSPSGLGVKIKNMADPESFDGKIEGEKRKKAEAKERVPTLESALKEQFSKQGELDEAGQELDRINAEMKAAAKDKPKEDIAADDSTGGDSYMLPLKASVELRSFINYAVGVKDRLVKHVVEQVTGDEAALITKKFKIKHPDSLTRTMDNYQIAHVLHEHGDPATEAARGNIAVTLDDLAGYLDIVKNADMKNLDSQTRNGKPAMVYGKQMDDGYYVVVEEVRTGKSDVAFFNMWKHRGTLTADDLKRRGVNSPSAGSQPAGVHNIIAEDEHFARANGYDEPGANFVPPYNAGGLPPRPDTGTIMLGAREVVLPPGDAPMNADTIRVYLSDIIGNRLYEGKVKGKSALGVYKQKDSAIRVKSMSNVEVMAHEMAHYLDFFYRNQTRKADKSFFRAAIMKNRDEVKALSYTTDKKKVISEGFAEFVRLWLTNYNTLEMIAPNMVRDFEARLATDKALREKMERLQEAMHQFYYQGRGVGKYIGGELTPTANRIKRSQAETGKTMRQQAIDKLHSIKRIEAAVRGDNAADALGSPYKMLQLVNGASSLLYSAMNIGVPTVAVDGDLTYSGKPLNDIFAPATSVGEDRVRMLAEYLVAKRASELTEQGRENLIPKEDIEESLKLAEIYPEFETISEEYQAFNDAMLDFYVGMNLITEAQRDTFKEFNENYVPFHRIIESVQHGEVPPAALGARLTGGTHSIDDIMENIINGLERNIKEALISRGKSAFYEMLEKSGMGGVYATRVAKESRKVTVDIETQAKAMATMMAQLGIAVSKDGMILSQSLTGSQEVYDVGEIEQNLLANPKLMEFWTHGHKPTPGNGTYIDSAIIDGQQVYFEVNDPGIVDALTSFRNAHYNKFVQGLMAVKNVMTWNITNNPLFYLTNFARDTVSASVLSKNKFMPVISSVAGMIHFVTKSKAYKDFMASGGGYGTRRTTLGRDIDPMKMVKVNRGLDLVGKLASAMEYGADVFEYGTRVGDFATAQKAGKSNMQSAYEGREVSTDFAIKGSNRTFTGFMATVPFMKAAINGLDKTARRVFSLNGEMKLSNAVKFRNQQGELMRHKIKIYATGGMLLGLTLGLWAWNRDDERYKRLTRDKKMMYWHFFIEDKHIQIPKPYDIGFVFAAVPELMADAVYTKHGEEALQDFLWGMKMMFSVGDVSGMFQPVFEAMRNKNWTGSPIVPYNMQNLDDMGDQYYSTTPLLYKKFGELTGASPIMTQHYIDGYLGLTAKMIEETTENLLWNKKEWGDRPFARGPLEFVTYRFRGKEPAARTKHSEKFYELMQKASAVKASYNKKRKEAIKDQGEAAKAYMSDAQKQAYDQVDKMMRHYRNILSNIKLEVESVTYDKKLSAKQKEEKINAKYEKRNEIFESVVTDLEAKLKKLEDR